MRIGSRSGGARETLHFLGKLQAKLVCLVGRQPVGQLRKRDLPHPRIALGPRHGRSLTRFLKHSYKPQADTCRIGLFLKHHLFLEQPRFGIGKEEIALAVESQAAFSLAISTSIRVRHRSASSLSGSNS